MVAPRMMDYNYRDKIDNLGIVLMSSGLAFNRLDENQKLFCPCGACALYSRELLTVIAREHTRDDSYYFDPSYFAYCEDLDLGWRARNAGFEPGYAKDAIVYHKGSSSTGKLSDFAVYHTYRNLLWTQIKNLPLALLLWQSPWLAAGWLFIFAMYLVKGRPRLIAQAFLDSVFGLQFMLAKRRQTQKKPTASNKEILAWFEVGLFPKNLLKK